MGDRGQAHIKDESDFVSRSDPLNNHFSGQAAELNVRFLIGKS